MATHRAKGMTEVTSGPHGEQDIADMPLETDHGGVTPENVGQNTSTPENRLDPSVLGPLEDPTTDSMFNLADPQTKELLDQSTNEHRPGSSSTTHREKKNTRKRKAA